jgi:hypothetical protein
MRSLAIVGIILDVCVCSCVARGVILNMVFKDEVALKGDHPDNAAHENPA